MAVSSTSTNAYHKIYDKLGDRQRKVFDALGHLGVASNEDLAEFLNWPINTITPRVLELRKYGAVGFEDFKTSKSGMKVKAWGIRIPREYQQAKLF